MHTLKAPRCTLNSAVEIRRNWTYHADASGTEHVTKTEPSTEELALMQTLTNVDTIIYDHARRMLNRQSTVSPATISQFSVKHPTTCGAPDAVSASGQLHRPLRPLNVGPGLSTTEPLCPLNDPSSVWLVGYAPKIVPEHDSGFRSAVVTYNTTWHLA